MSRAASRQSQKQQKPQKSRQSGCPISFSLDIFGDRWTLLVLRDLLMHDKRRYREFLSSDEGIASNILSDRLKRLEDRGIIARDADPDDKRQVIYTATPKGRSLLPILLEIAAWGASHDENTAAPSRFAESFYADRAAFYDNHRELIARLFEEDER